MTEPANVTPEPAPGFSVLGQAEQDDTPTVRGEDDASSLCVGDPIPDALDTFGDDEEEEGRD